MKHRLKPCEICGKTIKKERNRNWNEYAKKRFCSRACNAVSQSQKVTVHCKNCGKKLRRPPSHVRGSVYCNRKCRTLAKTTLCVCEICGKEFRRANSETIDGRTGKPYEHTYCSMKCQGIGKRVEMVTVVCDFCGNEVERYPSDISRAEERGYTFSFCSHTCRAAMIAAQFNPPRPYKGKHTSAPRNGHRTRRWRKHIKERDNYTCQDCGATDKMLAVHHVKSYALYPELRYDVSNGVALCYECHEKRHSLHSTAG